MLQEPSQDLIRQRAQIEALIAFIDNRLASVRQALAEQRHTAC